VLVALFAVAISETLATTTEQASLIASGTERIRKIAAVAEEEANVEEEGQSETDVETESKSESESEAEVEAATEMEVSAQTEAEIEATATLAASVSAMSEVEVDDLNAAADQLEHQVDWVYARVRRASKKCCSPRRRFVTLSRHHHHRPRHHHSHTHHHDIVIHPVRRFKIDKKTKGDGKKKGVVRRVVYESPMLSNFVSGTCCRRFDDASFLTHYLHTAFSRLMTPVVDPLYHSSFGKCRHFKRKRSRKQCRRLRLARKGLASGRFFDRLDDERMLRPKGGRIRQARFRHVKRSLSQMQKQVAKLGRAMALLQADVSRVSKRLTGISFKQGKPLLKANRGAVAKARKHKDSAATATSQAKTAANLAHMNRLLTKIRSRLPKMVRKLGKMGFDVKKIHKHVRKASVERRRQRHRQRFHSF